MRSLTLFAMLLMLSTTNISAQGQDATAKLLERYEKDIERLEKENESLKDENTKLKEEIEALKISAGVDPKGDDAKEKKDMTPLDSLWKGKFGSVQNGQEKPVQTAAGRVIKREKDALTITIKLENGTNWQYDFKYTGRNKFVLTETRRITAANGVDTSTAPPVGGVTGTGTTDGKKMSIITKWPGAAGGLLTSRYEFQRE